MNVILIDKNGNIDNKILKELNQMYLLCKYRNNDSFIKLHSWLCEDYVLELYGKPKGKKNNLNNFEFPQPIDSECYYGILCIAKFNLKEELMELTLDEWGLWYNTMLDDSNKDTSSETSDLNYHFNINEHIESEDELKLEDYIDELK